MSHTDIDLLARQLQASLADGPPDTIERAGLAWLLARWEPQHPLLSDLSLAADAATRVELESSARTLAEAVEDCDEDDEPEVSWDRLTALDELCAAAHWLSASEAVAEAVVDACATLSAFPEPWAVHAPLASALLQRCPPRPGDPALRLWQVVESAVLPVVASHDAEPGAPGRVRIAAGLDVVIEFPPLRASARRAAASDLPDAPPWQSLREAEDWSAGLTTEDGEVWLVVQGGVGDGSAPVSVACDGEPVELQSSLGSWRCRARAGRWRLEGSGSTVAFTLQDET